MFTSSLFHVLRGSTESHKTMVSVWFQSFFTVLFPQNFLWLFQHFSRKMLQTMKTTTKSPKSWWSHWGWWNVSLCFTCDWMSPCVLGVKSFPTTTLVRPAYWGVESILYPVIFFTALANKRCWNCSVCQLTAVADCSELSLGQPGSKSSLQYFCDCSDFCHQL